MKIIFLGTNGWYSTPTGDTACVLVDAKDHYVVFDAGNGFNKLDKYIKEDKPISLFISHFHIDHISGLHTLMKFAFKRGIDVYMGEGRKKDFNTLVNPPFTIGYMPGPENISELKTEIRPHELSARGDNIPFPAFAIKQRHAYTDHGYRIELEGKILVYTGDLGLTDAARELARDADLLISECSSKNIQDPDTWGHMDPARAASLAKESNVGKLILTHFNAALYSSLDERRWAEDMAKKIFPNTVAAKDGMELSVEV